MKLQGQCRALRATTTSKQARGKTTVAAGMTGQATRRKSADKLTDLVSKQTRGKPTTPTTPTEDKLTVIENGAGDFVEADVVVGGFVDPVEEKVVPLPRHPPRLRVALVPGGERKMRWQRKAVLRWGPPWAPSEQHTHTHTHTLSRLNNQTTPHTPLLPANIPANTLMPAEAHNTGGKRSRSRRALGDRSSHTFPC
jgi:hypothetical protein